MYKFIYIKLGKTQKKKKMQKQGILLNQNKSVHQIIFKLHFNFSSSQLEKHYILTIILLYNE